MGPKARRLMFAVVIAVAISGVLTLWLSKTMFKQSASRTKELQYIVTARKMSAGEVLKNEDLAQKNWPASVPLTGAHVQTSEVVGRILLYPLAAGEPVQDDQLAPAGSGIGLTTKIPSGLRALSLRSDEIVGVAGFLNPGVHVDVLVTYVSTTSAEPITSIVLQNVEVLAVGQKMDADPKGKPTPVGVVTLLVSPQDAEKAVLASAQGKVHFVLRNDSDSQPSNVAPVLMSELSQHESPAPRRKVEVVQKAPTPAPPPTKYSIEIVAGDSTTRETFQ